MKKTAPLSLLILLITTLSHAQGPDLSLLNAMKARNIGPGGMSGRVTAIDVRPDDPATFYVGTASGGIWKTTSGGTSFEAVFDDEAVANIGAIAVDPVNPDVVWAGTGEGNPRNSLNGGYGIYKSLDGGRSWTLLGLEATRHIHRIIVHPRNPDIVYVGAIGSPWGPHPERGVYKTVDGGKSWELILSTNHLSGVADMVMDPKNPDKLFIAMWEHQRWPWFFKSGGSGSGLYMTVDGGGNWKQLGADDGLPGGELGRIGLAIAASDTRYVYALVESKKNAIYRSTDGGYTWEKRGTENIGNRPFYYADIYVDPSNENRLYSLYSVVNVSEDGGKNFSTLIGYNIHLDHHAWWIHPENPDFMIDGNDGGLAITYDAGRSWRHVTNLPVSQFYHIRYDMEIPYNVYGGMQDNGSWRGPAYAWSSGGIINTYWDFLMGGDGFDVLPVPGDPRYCYAMSQQGHLRRLDLQTGDEVDIRPAEAEGEKLRFHWNSAIAQDPFDANTIYFGSQYVHRSSDRGDSWTKISPDLSSNDSTKQKYGQSGGLTYDVTGAETHTCILAITPSKVEEGLLWVGTDDGQVQLSRDGGESWKNLTAEIKELPEGAWIPQIIASEHSAGEAWVVVNNYRLNDYAPYLFHTRDYGRKWTRVVGEGDVAGYVLSFAQDPEVEALQFLGTEYGLYLSIDGGEHWTKWDNDFPTVSTMDLQIHPREADLIIGTFGRSAWILDDLRPLRALAADYETVSRASVFAVDAPVAYQAAYSNAPGYYFTGDAYFEGRNRDRGAPLSFFLAMGDSAVEKKDSVQIRIMDADGKLVRTLNQPAEKGLNRVIWNMDRKGCRLDFSEQGSKRSQEAGGGGYALPGSYTFRVEFRGDSSEARLELRPDPRMIYDEEGHRETLALADDMIQAMQELNDRIERIRACKKTISLVKELAGEALLDSLEELSTSMSAELNDIESMLFRDRSIQGIYTEENLVSGKIRTGQGLFWTRAALTENQREKYQASMKVLEESTATIDQFLGGSWAAYREAVEASEISLFSEGN